MNKKRREDGGKWVYMNHGLLNASKKKKIEATDASDTDEERREELGPRRRGREGEKERRE